MSVVKSICPFSKSCFENRVIPLSVTLALLLSLPGVAQSAVVTYCCDATAETAYQTALDGLSFVNRAPESFEDGAWVAARTIPQSSVTNLGITWERSGAFLRTSTNGGDLPPGTTGSYVMFTWDNSSGLPLHAIPDGYTLTANGFPLYGVGGWFSAGTLAELAFFVDGDQTPVDFTGAEATVTDWKFLGFIENDSTLGFSSVMIRETDETGDETRIFFSDDFTLGAAAVPLPAALPLFGTGLMAMMGLLGRRGKRT